MDRFTSLLVSSVYQFLGEFHCHHVPCVHQVSTVHPLFSGDGSSISMWGSWGAYPGRLVQRFSWQKQCCWGVDCDWGRQNVRGRKEEMSLLSSWGSGSQCFTDLPHLWQEACSKVMNWVQMFVSLLSPSLSRTVCFQLQLLLLCCCRVCSHNILTFLDLLALWK